MPNYLWGAGPRANQVSALESRAERSRDLLSNGRRTCSMGTRDLGSPDWVGLSSLAQHRRTFGTRLASGTGTKRLGRKCVQS